MSATDELRALLDERGVEWMPSEWNRDGETFWHDSYGLGVLAGERGEKLFISLDHLTPEQAVETTLGHSGYTYEQWRSISDAIGDAMEYAHDRAIECPDKADPLWNLDEYVSRVLKVAFEGEAMLRRAYDPPVAAHWDGDVLILTIPRDPSSIHVQRAEGQPRKVYAGESEVVAATLGGQPPYGELIEALRRDWDIEASWDGLRRFWYIGLTEEGMRKRDEREATLGRGECQFKTVVDQDPSLRHRGDICECGGCGYRCARGFIVDERFKYCPNCGRKVAGE